MCSCMDLQLQALVDAPSTKLFYLYTKSTFAFIPLVVLLEKKISQLTKQG
jgi:hypothetical protein